MKTDAKILRGEATCSTCRKPVPENAARAVLYVSPAHVFIACIECAQSEARGLNHEIVKVPSGIPGTTDGRVSLLR
jgi:hypothetical protein